MYPYTTHAFFLVSLALLLLASCHEETHEPPSKDAETEMIQSGIPRSESENSVSAPLQPGVNLQKLLFPTSGEPTECGNTEFGEIQWKYFTELAGDPIAVAHLDQYLTFNEYAAILGIGGDYFGPEGEYTSVVRRTVKNLERFWDMEGEIRVVGQHNETLNDREKLADLLWHIIADLDSREDVYPLVDEILEANRQSPHLPESPLFSSDGYASPNHFIVLGDGLLQMFIESGVAPEVAWTAILSHEWAHQIQIRNLSGWYGDEAFDSQGERTRHLELEADFFSGYYLSHKRGATYNWKRVEHFYQLFFQAGDCAFETDFHHGTPLQRKKAAQAGYELAESAQKKGQILSPEEVHQIFIHTVLPELL